MHDPPFMKRTASDRRVIAVVVVVQALISLGYFAVMTHVVLHLRDDLGLLAGTITLMLGLRTALQYALFLPVGAVIDLVGAARAGVVACALRAVGFAALGAAGGPPGLFASVLLLAVGGALFHAAAQSLLAGVAPERRARGFAAYTVVGQAAAVAGPPAGLLLLGGGFGLVATAAATAWAVAALLFLLLNDRPRTPRGRTRITEVGRRMSGSVATVLRDRGFVRWALAVSPVTLLLTQTMTVVPLTGSGPGRTTLFLSVAALVASLVQPWCAAARRGEDPRVLKTGLLCAGAGYALLAALPDETGRLTVLLLASVLSGLATGLCHAATFQTLARSAPPGRFGAYFGVLHFFSGLVALAGGTATGRLIDAAPWGTPLALTLLATLSVLPTLALRGPHEDQPHRPRAHTKAAPP
ncbi:MFS transporter [Thermomonospora umbrina]|uniref:MFS transporter n=1 Tax=Thermomonospora umbrina TaxID=111806 RepID=UPI0011C175AF|nr:MFS transporter [Thermomonospora umbrina]